jgi:DNA-directed RNA polymerase subunit RPC12/RpoP
MITPQQRAARMADHEAGKHADLETFVRGCPPCEVEEETLDAKREAGYAAALRAARKAAREASPSRAARPADAGPEAVAYRCAGCGTEFTAADADQGQGLLYECGECGCRFSWGSDGSNRCPECNRCAAKIADLACPECNEGELEPVGGPEPT